jgi:glycosyltransferase involved in cell wall biosynthesis
VTYPAAVPQDRFSIAQVTPYAWEQHHEVNTYVERLSDELCRRGHRVVVIAPSDSRELIREGRRTVRRVAEDPEAVFAGEGCVQVLAVGQSLPFPPARRGPAVSLPLDVSRTVEELLGQATFDFVHVHEPFAPSAASAALRHSRALNVGSFHAATERVLSTQVARRLVELLFGRLDGRAASWATTRDLVSRFFPGDYAVIRPGADVVELASAPADGPIEILFCLEEERAALRLFLRALRRLPLELPWHATVWSRLHGPEPTVALSRALRERVRFAGPTDGSEAQRLARAHVVVAASAGVSPAPQLLLRALGGGAVPVASRLPVYEEVLEDGERGLLFEPRDATTLASQLERLVVDDALRRRLHDQAAAARHELSWERVADSAEQLYRGVADRRHEAGGKPEVRRRLASRDFLHVDLHMHTDHSPDCATPVETLIATAERAGLGVIAVTDHNEISGALDARERANGRVKVIVGEEVKTADQGEVIGLFIEEKIPRGMTLEEAARFAAKYRIVAGAGSDSHVAQGLGSVKIKMRDFDGPEEFLESLRDADIVRKRQSLLYVQALKFIQTKTRPPSRRRDGNK